MKALELKETERDEGINYTIFDGDRAIAAWHSDNRITASEVFVTRDSNGNFIRHNTMPTDRTIYGVATLTEFFDRNVPVNNRGFITEAI